ncbi:hypothetical protein BC351_26020 [Paenibacillus ferrarius]|uniref:HAMP domain-containing protein n=1 Tax=Paenibacillus ferrarius TaxID=1469647 RepID=A0A1V4HJ95_9BACL|nr:histidine kinase [Paenibacillus ferrarius]OPH56878.1 hypothetical protein BC351_26020 [Paenibacillus ferrarius]
MKIEWRIRQFSIFPKIIIAFLLIILPIYVLSLVMNISGEASVREEISMSMKSRVHFYLNSFESEMNRLIKLNREYSFDEDLRNLSTIAPGMNEFDRVKAILSLQNKLLLMKNSSLYVADVKVYIPLLERTIHANYYGDELPLEELQVLENFPDNHTYPFIYWQNRLLISELYPKPITPNKMPFFASEVELSENEIKQSLLQASHTSQGGAVLMDPSQSWFIANDQDLRMVPKLKEFLMRKPFQEERIGQGYLEMERKNYLITYERSQSLNTIFMVYVPESQILGPLNTYRHWFLTLSISSVLFIILFSAWIYRQIHQPLRNMVIAFRKVEAGNLGITIKHKHNDEFDYLYKQFNEMVNRLQMMIHEVYEEKIRSQRAELKQLQSQINPHFLYNSYFVLYRMAKSHDIDNVIRFTKHLGDYFQFITRNAPDEVSLELEIKLANAYVEIQMIRFSNRMETKWHDLSNDCKDLKLPRLILQPIIENAYNHGLEHKLKGGKVEIKLMQHAGNLCISIEDNGEGLSDEALEKIHVSLLSSYNIGETTGLQNVHARLQLRFGSDSGLSVSRGQMGGLRVEMKFPIKKGEHDVPIIDS